MRLYLCLNESCMFGLLGFFVCSMFLSLENFEVLYYMLALSNGVLLGVREVLPEATSSVSRQRGPQPRRQRVRVLGERS